MNIQIMNPKKKMRNNMKMLNQKKSFKAVLTSVAIAVSAFSAPAHADTAKDTAVLLFKAALITEMQRAAEEYAAKQAEKEAAANSSADCQAIDQAGVDAAKASLERNQPPDPTKIIQNTTCFVDVSKVKIPITITGMGFIQPIINALLQKFMTGACGKAQNFLTDMATTAVKQLDQKTDGSLSFAYSLVPAPVKAAGEAKAGALLSDIQKMGNDQIDGLMGEITLQTVDKNAGYQDQVHAGKDSAAALAKEQAEYEIKAKRILCQRGVSDPVECPMCMSDPNHWNCLGVRPICDRSKYPGVTSPNCREYHWDSGN